MLVVLLAMAGCSQPTSAPEQGEKEDVEEAVGETVRVVRESTQAATIACSDFPTPEDAMDYYTTDATEAEKGRRGHVPRVCRRRDPVQRMRGGVMAKPKTKAKSGMEGRTSRTSRWGTREEVKDAARKQRRKDDRSAVREDG